MVSYVTSNGDMEPRSVELMAAGELNATSHRADGVNYVLEDAQSTPQKLVCVVAMRTKRAIESISGAPDSAV